MFNLARLKLTAWYLLIIMFVSAAFSLVIYQTQVDELNRFAMAARLRLDRRFTPIDLDLIEESKQRIVMQLVVINSCIFILAGGFGYFLAGRTLNPIKEMMDEQNRFISDASHELRTPITAIKSALEVNLKDKKLLKDCLGQLNKMQFLSESLLSLSRYNNNQKIVNKKTISFEELVESALNTVRPLAADKRININFKKTNVRFFGDKNSLSELLVILLDNAIKYSPEKSEVFITASHDSKGEQIEIIDQGIGIEKKDLPHVFDRFFRADTARQKTSAGGYGLGLSIAKKIVELHGGTIEIDSQKDKGTKVVVGFLKGGEA